MASHLSRSLRSAAAGSIAVLTGGGLFRGDVHAEDINKKTFVPFRVISNTKERSALCTARTIRAWPASVVAGN
jgi:hypothetical protein